MNGETHTAIIAQVSYFPANWPSPWGTWKRWQISLQSEFVCIKISHLSFTITYCSQMKSNLKKDKNLLPLISNMSAALTFFFVSDYSRFNKSRLTWFVECPYGRLTWLMLQDITNKPHLQQIHPEVVLYIDLDVKAISKPIDSPLPGFAIWNHIT